MDPHSGASSPDQIIGQTVGNYLVTQKLGEGGMGSVYLAEHPTIGKKVALKVLHAEFSNNPEVAERFFTEAKSVNSIGHPNIVDIVDYGVLQTGQGGRDRLVYFIMEYLHGATLSQALAQGHGPMQPERALTIALQVADALAASHKQGIVHRDLKPDNIILIQRGREADFVKLLDFGIAKLTGSDGMSSHKTRTGLVLGTPAYMSPEQCEGKATVDHRTDVYALGVVLYEMLVGRVPFIGEGYGEILVQHLTQQPVPPSQYRMMSPHIEQVVLKALEKRPDMRYPTMDEFMRAMADPVGYVEAHGGLSGFLAKQLVPSTAALPPLRMTTPAPLTPVPGMTGVMSSPVPGTMAQLSTPSPTTLGAAAGQMSPAKNKTPFIIAGVLVTLGAAAAVFMIMSKKHAEPAAKPDTGSAAVIAMDKGSAAVAVETPPNNGSAVGVPVVDNGSAATPPQNGSAGSAGSAATPPPDNKGSAEVKTPEIPTNNGSADKTIVKMTPVTITSDPPGADIYINGMSVGKKTPSELNLPRDSVKVSLRLKGYDEARKNVKVGESPVKIDEKLRVKSTTVQTGTGKGSGAGKGSGSGKGKSTKTCDTCLERPD
jgi:serine/threonine-protein kinase